MCAESQCHLIPSDWASISKACSGKGRLHCSLSFLLWRLLQNIHQGRLVVRLFIMVFYGKYCVCSWDLQIQQISDMDTLLMFADNCAHTLPCTSTGRYPFESTSITMQALELSTHSVPAMCAPDQHDTAISASFEAVSKSSADESDATKPGPSSTPPRATSRKGNGDPLVIRPKIPH